VAVVQAPAIEGAQRVRWQALPAVQGGIDTDIREKPTEGLVHIAIPLAGGLLAASEGAVGPTVTEADGRAGIDAVRGGSQALAGDA
jgi:hypothetical protein